MMGFRTRPLSTLTGRRRMSSRAPMPASAWTVTTESSCQEWQAMIRNSGRVALSPSAVSTSGTPSITVLEKPAVMPAMAGSAPPRRNTKWLSRLAISQAP